MRTQYLPNLSSVNSVGVTTEPNIKFRTTMEDEHVIIDKFGGEADWGFFAIYDGHGGNQVSGFAKSYLDKKFLEYLKPDQVLKSFSESRENVGDLLSSDDFGDVEEDDEVSIESTESKGKITPSLSTSSLSAMPGKIPDIFTKTYQKIDKMTKNKGFQSVGSTAVTCFITKEDGVRKLYTANVGDSRAVLCRNKKAVRLSFDHKPTVKEEEERIISEGGFVSFNRTVGVLAVSRALGDHAIKPFVTNIPYVSEVELEDTDSFLILACDGLWDIYSDQEAVELIIGMEKPEEMSQKLVKNAIDKGSTDNISCIVVIL
ncbi:hypothetical protein M0811_09815 [Anaeramoeba ignava]|uniref:PPM-type phosphatase domain-containing protein n=1 Tax=Anaeramoeba ignava TaxID=1746090 RepID=A0A9Q0LER9_ANAIG|nr:hypothetical protein M0811_09815 [Anaeramoeba ignava]